MYPIQNDVSASNWDKCMVLCPQLEMGNLVLTAPKHDLLRVKLIPLLLSTSLEYISS